MTFQLRTVLNLTNLYRTSAILREVCGVAWLTVTVVLVVICVLPSYCSHLPETDKIIDPLDVGCGCLSLHPVLRLRLIEIIVT